MHKYKDDVTNDGQQDDTQCCGTGAMVPTLLPVVRHINFVSVLCLVVEFKVHLLSFQNHLYLLHLVRMSARTTQNRMCKASWSLYPRKGGHHPTDT